MLFNNFNILTALFQSVITGYFTYFLLKSNDLLVLSNAKKEEKTAIVSFLSILNWSIYWIMQQILKNILPHLDFAWLTTVTAVISLVLILVLGVYIFPKVLSSFFEWFNKLRTKNNKLPFTRKPIRDEALDGKTLKYIYLFDFDGKYIASGYLNVYQYDIDEYNELLLYAPKEPELTKTIEDVEKLFQKYDINILVDYEKRVKLYIVPMGEVEDVLVVE
ncbi:hypothetical protein [Enterococcus sp. 105332]|uniref:hypothetical protein n=1 Tax=Enterococcus sp. 105332 TaxID=2725309 RepID=UPI0014745843|nr:hypothetical protein [Enterococcus sp. 105332]NMF11519.1 hypothetical protein [Enterococcus sp. 105332]